MRKLLAALFFWFIWAIWFIWGTPLLAQVGPPNQVQCNNIAYASALAAAGTVALTTPVNYASSPAGGLVGIAGKSIYICGWHATGAAGGFQIVTGTGATCGTGTIALTPAFSVTTTAPSQDHIDYATLSVPAGNNVCLTTTGTVTTFSFGLWYGQF